MTYNERWTTGAILAWTAAWYAVRLGDGQPGWRVISWLAVIPMMVAVATVIVWATATSVHGTVARIWSQAPLWRGAIPVATVLVGVPVACLSPVPASYEANEFKANRIAFVSAADAALAEMEEAGSSGVTLPDSPLYDTGFAWRNHVEFVLTDFDRPLVFIVSDDPDDVFDTCSAGGVAVESLEAGWYVCDRDWN